METLSLLALAFIAVRNAHRRQDAFVPEPHEFQRFDVQALGLLYHGQDDSPSRPSDRQESNGRSSPSNSSTHAQATLS